MLFEWQMLCPFVVHLLQMVKMQIALLELLKKLFEKGYRHYDCHLGNIMKSEKSGWKLEFIDPSRMKKKETVKKEDAAWPQTDIFQTCIFCQLSEGMEMDDPPHLPPGKIRAIEQMTSTFKELQKKHYNTEEESEQLERILKQLKGILQQLGKLRKSKSNPNLKQLRGRTLGRSRERVGSVSK